MLNSAGDGQLTNRPTLSLRKKVHGFEFIDAARICVRPSVCPFDRQQQRRPAGLLLSSLLAGDVDHLLRTRCGRRAAGANAQQQMRVASC